MSRNTTGSIIDNYFETEHVQKIPTLNESQYRLKDIAENNGGLGGSLRQFREIVY